MGGKVHQTEEEKFLESLKSWGEDIDNRPFIRVKENKEKDDLDYKRKESKIKEEKESIAKLTGDPIENINLYDSRGHCYSDRRNIRDFEKCCLGQTKKLSNEENCDM